MNQEGEEKGSILDKKVISRKPLSTRMMCQVTCAMLSQRWYELLP